MKSISKEGGDVLIPEEAIMRKIILIRGQKVMISNDLAELYGVSTKRLNEQVKRNIKRFPQHFMFQLTEQEKEMLEKQKQIEELLDNIMDDELKKEVQIRPEDLFTFDNTLVLTGKAITGGEHRIRISRKGKGPV